MNPLNGGPAISKKAVPEKPSQRWWMLVGVWLLYLAFGLNIAGLAPLVPVIEHDLAMSHSAMGQVLGVWQLVYIAASIPCGVLLDRLGSRWSMLVGALLIAISAFWRGAADDAFSLLLAVAVFGLGGPIISAGAPKVVSAWFQGRQRGLAMGIYITGPGIGAIISLLLTNAWLMPLFDGDWRLILRLWGAVAVFAALVWVVISRISDRRPIHKDHAPAFRGEIKALLSLPAVRLLLLMSIGVFTINHGLSNWLPELLRAGGWDITQASNLAAFMVACAILSALVVPRLAVRERRLLVLLFLFLCTSAATVLLRSPTGPGLVTGLILQGIASGSMMTLLILILVELPAVGERRAGTASGLFFSAAEIGGVGGPVMLGVLYDSTGGFGAGLGVLTAAGLLLAGSILALRKHVEAPPGANAK